MSDDIDDIDDMIESCDLLPTEDTNRTLLEICSALNKKVKELEAKHEPTVFKRSKK